MVKRVTLGTSIFSEEREEITKKSFQIELDEKIYKEMPMEK